MELRPIGNYTERLSPTPSANQRKSPKQNARYWHYSWQPPASAPGAAPRSRNSHAACSVGGEIFLLGGKDGTVSHKDMWKYNSALERWEAVKGTGDRPLSLQGHTMTADGKKLYVFGGKFNFGSDDDSPFWIFDTETNIWEKSTSPSDVMTPMGRREHTAVLHQGALHIYGGYIDLKGSSSELWSYNFVHDMWHLCYCTALVSDGPGGRHAHSAVVHNNDMWVFGGMNDLQAKDELWRWSLGMQRWTRVRAKGPPALKDHSACKLGEKMLLYGGLCDGQLYNQLWTFHFVSHTWSKVAVPGMSPPACIKHCVVVIPSAHVLEAARASQTDRSFSTPQLGDASPLPAEYSCRPLSSPPSIEGQRNFRNRIGPTASKTRNTQTAQCDNPRGTNTTVQFSNPVFNKNIAREAATNDEVSARSAEHRDETAAVAGHAARKKSEWGSVGSVLRYTDKNPLLDMGRSQTFSDTESLHSSGGALGVNNPTFACDTNGQFVRVRRSSESVVEAGGECGTPAKRHRYCSQFSDDFVAYKKSASAESILSAGRKVRKLGDYEKSMSLGSLNNHLGSCDISNGLWDWDIEPRSSSRDDLILEDIEDCGSELFAAAAAAPYTMASASARSVTDAGKSEGSASVNWGFTSHYTTNPTHRKNIISVPGKCTHNSLVCLHEEESISEGLAQREDDHRTNGVEEASAHCDNNSYESTVAHQSASMGISDTRDTTETSFVNTKKTVGQANPASIAKYRDVFINNSTIAENKYFMYIIGGKTNEAQNLHVKPLSMWKLDIDIV